MKSIIYYCGEDFDPTCGQELSAHIWLLRKITHAKDTKYEVDTTTPFDSIRSNRIATAIEKWETQYSEIFGLSKDIE